MFRIDDGRPVINGVQGFNKKTMANRSYPIVTAGPWINLCLTIKILCIMLIGLISCNSKNSSDKKESNFSTRTFLNEIYNYKQSLELQEVNDSIISRLGKTDSVLFYHKATRELVTYIDLLREQIINATGGYSHKWYRYSGLDSTNTGEIITNILVVNKKGEELQDKLNAYAEILKINGIRQFPLAPDGKDDPVLRDNSFKENPALLPNRFYYLHFNNANLLNALITLTNIRNRVLISEQMLLLRLIKPIER